MAEYEKLVRAVLKDSGYSFQRQGKGDHEIWHNLATGRSVTVDGRIKSRHTANAIMKQCGIRHHF